MITIKSIREIPVRLQGDIQNAVVSFSQHDVSLVAVTASAGGSVWTGFGFNSIGRFAQSGILQSRLIPRVLAADPERLVDDATGELDPGAVARVAMANEKPGGHGDRAGAVAALELAIWDLNAKIAQEPAYALISKKIGRGVSEPLVETYAAGGYYYEGRGLDGLKRELESYQSQGYTRCKIKIGGASLAEDMRRFDIAAEVTGHGQNVAVDANGRFDLATATAYLNALASRQPAWVEELLDPLDYQGLSKLIDLTDIPMATGENLFSLADALNLYRYGGMRPKADIFQMDPGLSYGLTEYLKIVAALEASGFDRRQLVPHGGHLINLHIVAGLGLGGAEAYPFVFQPFGGYPETCVMEDGHVRVSNAPGFGLEEKPELASYLDQVRAEERS